MGNISIPGPVTNNLRQGLTLRMGDAIQALDTASLIDRRERTEKKFTPYINQIDAIRGLFDVLGWEHVDLDTAEIESVEIDLDEHREALEEGLDEATLMLRRFIEEEEGRPDQRREAITDLAEIERFAASLAALR